MNQTSSTTIAQPADPPGRAAALLSVREVSQLLACSQRTVYRLSDAGRMPRPLPIGRLRRWNHAAVSKWIADGCPNMRGGRGAAL